jgi:hypothetical protein
MVSAHAKAKQLDASGQAAPLAQGPGCDDIDELFETICDDAIQYMVRAHHPPSETMHSIRECGRNEDVADARLVSVAVPPCSSLSKSASTRASGRRARLSGEVPGLIRPRRAPAEVVEIPIACSVAVGRCVSAGDSALACRLLRAAGRRARVGRSPSSRRRPKGEMAMVALDRERWGRTAILSVLAVCLGCGEIEDDEGMTFEEFEASVDRHPATGFYLVEGDIPLRNRDELYDYYLESVRGGRIQSGLLMNVAFGADTIWGVFTRWQLTYCVDLEFGARHGAVVQAMGLATRAWEDAAGIDFRHVPTQDGNCQPGNGTVMFDVQPITTDLFMANAFFPNHSRDERTLWIADNAFTQQGVPLGGVLRHELGHVLGFRHEHIRDETVCPREANPWRALTPYDAGSVMHYNPNCGFDNIAGPYRLTSLDRLGAAMIYGTSNDYQPGLNDYQGDGRDDLLCRDGADGTKWVDFADGSGRLNGTDWQGAPGWCSHANTRLVVGDFNGDNGPRPDDLLCHDPTSGFLWIDYASGGTFGGTNWQRDARFCNHEAARLLVGDFNGDGSDDLLCHDHTSGYKWIDYASGGQFNGTNWERNGLWCNHDTGRLFIGDFNADGRDDLLCHDHDTGMKWVDFANASGQFLGTDFQGGGSFCSHDQGRLFVGDFNGDNRDDLLCHDVTTGTKWIDYADGAGHFGGPNWSIATTWCSHAQARLFVGDINGDNRDDLLCHDVSSGMKWVDYADSSGRFLGNEWQIDSHWCAHNAGELH